MVTALRPLSLIRRIRESLVFRLVRRRARGRDLIAHRRKTPPKAGFYRIDL
jgi:hypothetical protein